MELVIPANKPATEPLAALRGNRFSLTRMKPMKPMEPMKPMQPMKPMEPMQGMSDDPASRWWPDSLGTSPNSAGGQNEMRYAYFGDKQRLAIDTGSGVSVYDTGEHKISGVQQQQDGGGKKIVFTSQKGEMDLDALKKVGS